MIYRRDGSVVKLSRQCSLNSLSGLTPEDNSARPSGRNSGADSFPQQITFEFRERRHHRTDQLALRRGQIEAISGPWRGESAYLAGKSIGESGLAFASYRFPISS